MAKPGRPTKMVHEYLTEHSNPKARIGHDAYRKCPAQAFLSYVIEAKDAIDLCIRQLPKKQDGNYTQASQDALHHLSSSMLPTVMGHFETYLRFLFAGTFDNSDLFSEPLNDSFLKQCGLITSGSMSLIPNTVLAHRGKEIQSIGLLLADNMNGWHNPDKVNRYFKAFGINNEFFNHTQKAEIEILWQLRHSIVHTGGTISIVDSHKIKALSSCGNSTIAFENRFIIELCKRFHLLVKDVGDRHWKALQTMFTTSAPDKRSKKNSEYFEVKSSYPSFFKTT